MKIAASQIDLQASHSARTESSSHERLTVWQASRPAASATAAPPSRPAPNEAVSLSERGRSLAASDTQATDEASDEDSLSPQLRMMVSMIEYFTGRSVHLFQAQHLDARPASGDLPANLGTVQSSGLEYIHETHYSEHEHVSFHARGSVTTADGREIQFELGFEMQRSYSESTHFSVRMGGSPPQELQDPLVFDFGGHSQGLSDMRFSFDLDSDGVAEALPMLNQGRGYLAFDRNANGVVDNGRELFGPQSGDGFKELEALDSDGNGWIDEADRDFDKLYVWRPSADGAGTLESLRDAGVGALHVGRVNTPFELRGAHNDTLGMMRSSGIYLNEDGTAGTISQIDLSV